MKLLCGHYSEPFGMFQFVPTAMLSIILLPMDASKAKLARIKKDLADMKRRDDRMRSHEPWDDSISEENTKRIQKIVEEIGWPTISLVGKDAAKQAWDIVQHVTPHSTFHHHCLKLMKECPPGEIELSQIAHFEDRIRISNGMRQLYGTEFRQTADGQFEPFPIEDFERLDERRLHMGLERFDVFVKKMNAQGVPVTLSVSESNTKS